MQRTETIMPVEHSIWRVNKRPEPLHQGALPSEQLLEDMIVAAPEMLSNEWMIIGRQVNTGVCGRIDLVAVAPDGAIILIELKRDRTPREVVGQALDYASWLERLDVGDIERMYANYSIGRNLAYDFQTRFGTPLDEDELNVSQQIVIVASSVDPSSERVIQYLNDRDIPINVLFFQIFESSGEQLLSRAWLLDPIATQLAATNTPGPRRERGTSRREREPWNGEFYVSYGHSDTRSWDDAVQYGFVCAGGGAWYSGTLHLLQPGDRIWVKAPGYGFVGVGRVTGTPIAAANFTLPDSTGEMKPALQVLTKGSYHREYVLDPERSEYFVPVEWLQTVPLARAVQQAGMFGNQNTVCRPTTPGWSNTVEQLKQAFSHFDDQPSSSAETPSEASDEIREDEAVT
jgi:hypothetical protein